MKFKECGRRLLGAILLLAAMATPAAWGRTVLDLDTALQPVPLLDWGDTWLDTDGRTPVERVAGGAAIPWKPSRQDAIYPLAPGRVLWVRFTIPPAPDAERWYLDIPYPAVDRVSLYTPNSLGQLSVQEAGDTLPVANWPVPHRHPLLPLSVSAEDPKRYFLRVENSHNFSAPLTFVSESYLSRNAQRTSLLLGIFFGLAGLAVLLAGLSAISLRDSAYGRYAVAAATMALFQASMTGIAGLHLWPTLPAWNNLASLVLPVLTVVTFLWFLSAAVSMPQRSRALHRFMMAVALLGLVAAAAIALVDPSYRARLQVLYTLVGSAVALVCVAWAAWRGDAHAGWLVLAMTPALIGAAFPMARTWGLVPISFWTQYAVQLGVAVELPMILVILILRSQRRRENSRRLQRIDRVDPATGLINAPVFQEQLDRAMARCARLKYHGAVLLIDIVNTEQIRRDFGPRAGDELPLRVAGRLLASVRDIDTVARISERRFGILMEGPVTPQDIASQGPRIVARCLMQFKDKPVEWVAQVRVAQTLVPAGLADAQEVVEGLAALLAEVPPESKRAVFTLAG